MVLRVPDVTTHVLEYKDEDSKMVLCSFTVKETDMDLTSEIAQKAKIMELVVDEGSERQEIFTDMNFVEYQKQKFIASVTNWTDVEDKDGNPMECTDDNKLKFFAKFFNIAVWVNNRIDDLSKKRIEENVELTKNLQTPEDGSPEPTSA